MSQKYSLSQWHHMAQEGAWLPLRIQVNGTSMYPLLRRMRDYVTIRPVEEFPQNPVRGDIILFSDPVRQKRYVLHRVWQVTENGLLTWGDNCLQPDGVIPFSYVWGKAVLIERGKMQIKPDPAKGIRLAKCWHVLGKGYRARQRMKQRIKNLIKKLIRLVKPAE